MALTGHLSDLSLSELIEFFCNQRKTGQLKVLYPQGPGYFYLQTGSVIDARIGVLRGIDAVYYALTLPNAKFEFSGSAELTERTINQPWTQVVLEGLRRLDEGVVPTPAFPADYAGDEGSEEGIDSDDNSANNVDKIRVPAFLSFMGGESSNGKRVMIAGAIALAVVASVAAIGVPAGWYGRSHNAVVDQAVTQPTNPETTASTSSAPEVSQAQPAQASVAATAPEHSEDPALAAKRQREKEKKAREERPAIASQPVNPALPPAVNNVEAGRPGARRVSVTVTYDESGRVTQASGGDPTALRIARQKRFPAGKAGSTTITIPIN
jgi:hypothetical protein